MPIFADSFTMMVAEWPFLDRLGYDGFIGCEHNPRGATLDGLGWFKTLTRS
ncbi:MAG TPA: hypothetical protein VNT30_10505 [Stellaceae bacterium]|nr:hypothetical protein [Stellaceae bacterium]